MIAGFVVTIIVLVGIISLLSWRLDTRIKECIRLEDENERITNIHNGSIKIDEEVEDEKKKPVSDRTNDFNSDNG